MEPLSSEYIVVIATCPNEREASHLASELVNQRLAACVQSSSIISTYAWKGRVETESEIRLLIKSTRRSYPKLQALIMSLSSYENPEVIAIPILQGSPSYLQWIDQETS